MNLAIDFVWLEATALAIVRITAFLVIAPPFSHGAIPLRIRAMLGVGLGLAVSPVVVAGYQRLDTGGFLLALAGQVLVGSLLGFLVLVLFSAVQSAGFLVDTFGGFQLAQAYDPGMNVNGAQFTRLFQMTAILLLFASNGYQLVLGGLFRSFDAVSVAGTFDLGRPAEVLTDAVGQMLVSAVQIAGPLLIVLFLADVGLGLVSRVAPALNAFALGFPIKIALTLLLVGFVFTALPAIVSSLAGDAAQVLIGVTR
ncbi:flagellar biosynthetic protein FliR [Microbacterium sp. KSW4-17]|uniref:Flagellar biosynthetic protein FliR n=1 Tax=Microbacterium galbum TaxID=3075994 RepID=A0ABU3T3K7_9MICO|nr:flagellar biosynthetic protein FliR [Microbacterium sp. KSW4-17]MDU0365961.1 flagellar biosynthetic protein FliR [Microbacterium sp. KSW4-17]